MSNKPNTRALLRTLDKFDALFTDLYNGPAFWFIIGTLAALDVFILIQILTSKAP